MGKKVKMKIKELADADVEYISLVSRPASKIPFRVTKLDDSGNPEELTMLDLNKGVFSQKSEGLKLVGIAVRPEHQAAKAEQLKAAGMAYEDTMEIDNAIVFKQEEFNEDEVQGIVLKDQSVALVTGVAKGFSPYENASSDFESNMQAMGFFPSLYTATDVLIDTVRKGMMSAESPDAAVGALNAALSGFSNYVSSLAGGLPEAVFKLDLAAAQASVPVEDAGAAETEAVKSEEAEDVAPADGDDAASEEPAGEAESGAEASSDAGAEAEGASDEPDTEGAEQAPVEKADDGDALSQILAAVQATNESVATVKSQVEGLSKTQADLAEQLSAVEKTAKSASEAVSGIVVTGGSAGDCEQPAGQARKGEGNDVWAGTSLDALS